jgi:hypothetical protein
MKLTTEQRAQVIALAHEIVEVRKNKERFYSGEVEILQQEAHLVELAARLDDSALETAAKEAQVADYADVMRFRAAILPMEERRLALLERCAAACEEQARAFTKIANLLESER